MRKANARACGEMPLTITFQSPWFPGFSPRVDELPVLFCFSYAGGSAESFWTWQESLASFARVCPVELPGRGRRYSEPFFSSVELCVKEVAQEIVRSKPASFYLFGHSLGSILALETVKILMNDYRRTPQALIVSGRQAPHVQPETRNISSASDEEVKKELRRLGGTPEELLNDQNIMDFILPIVRHDFALIERHRARLSPVADLPVYVCCGDSDPDVHAELLSHWVEVTTGECEIKTFKGGHFYIDENREALLNHVASIVNKYEAKKENI